MFDQQTLDVYNAKAQDYANMLETGVHHTIKRFAQRLPSQSLVLDLGCGHGINAAYLREQGMQIEAWDISRSMQQLAKQHFAIDVTIKSFDDLHAISLYQGICVNYSLLHIQPHLVPGYLKAMTEALKLEGWLHLGMKLGTGTERDKLGRYYAYYSEQQLKDWLTELGLQVEYTHQSVIKGLAGDSQKCIAIQARKTKL